MNKTGPKNWNRLLTPFTWLYGLVIWVRNTLYDNRILISTRFNIPIISVGNITVGGTGKTPHVEYLVQLLLDANLRVATLSRGYRRKTRDFRLASLDSEVREIGDEPMQIKKRFPGITVAVDRNRVHGVQKLMKLTPPAEVILLDDAYQHRSIKPGFSILLVDYNRPLVKDQLLPAGRLREPASNKGRANIIIVSRSPEPINPIESREFLNGIGPAIGQNLYFTTMRYGDLLPVYPGTPARKTEWFRAQRSEVLIVSGIANPHHLRQYAQSINSRFSEITFPDHHRYNQKDLHRISARFHELSKQGRIVLLLTTEKDATRISEHSPVREIKDAFYAVRIHVHFLNEGKKDFDRQIINYVNSNL